MVRGKIIVTCPHLGKTFVAPDIEWNATALSVPSRVLTTGETWIRMGKRVYGDL